MKKKKQEKELRNGEVGEGKVKFKRKAGKPSLRSMSTQKLGIVQEWATWICEEESF